MTAYYKPNEDPFFDSLKQTPVEENALGEIVGSGWGGSAPGPSNPWYGRKHSEETKKKMREQRHGTKNSNYGNKWSEEQRVSLSEYAKNRTPEHTKKLSESHLGKPTSDAQKKAVSVATKKRWAAYRAAKQSQQST